MKTMFWILLVCLFSAVSLQAEEDWPSDLAKQLEIAKETDRPVLVYFTATWCGPCRLMKRTTLADPKVETALGSWSRVMLDFDKNPELAKQYGIQGIPAFVILSSEGSEVLKRVGYMDSVQFENWLGEGMAAAAFAEGQKKAFEEQVSKLEESLKSSQSEVRARAIESLFDFCASTERSDREYALGKLKAEAERHPLSVVNGLNHPKLAVRIAVGQLLQPKLGDSFQFDPWLPSVERQAAAAKAKAILSKDPS